MATAGCKTFRYETWEEISRENVGGWKWEKKELQKELQPFLDGIALGKKNGNNEWGHWYAEHTFVKTC